MSTAHTYHCLGCAKSVSPDDACVEITRPIPVTDALTVASAEILPPEKRHDFIILRDAEADRWLVLRRADLMRRAVIIPGVRVVSHGPDLVLRQAFEALEK